MVSGKWNKPDIKEEMVYDYIHVIENIIKFLGQKEE